jgi:hypothetical protein
LFQAAARRMNRAGRWFVRLDSHAHVHVRGDLSWIEAGGGGNYPKSAGEHPLRYEQARLTSESNGRAAETVTLRHCPAWPW